MYRSKGITSFRRLALTLLLTAVSASSVLTGPRIAFSNTFALEAVQPGEVLFYDISWSRMLSAGTAVMEVRQGTGGDGKQVLDFVLTGSSKGLVDKLFPVNDRVSSVFDPGSLCSVSYSISENFGKKKRNKSLLFDRSANMVHVHSDSEPPRTVPIPAQAQDGLASLYYLRMRKDFIVGKVFAIDVHENGKNWSIEVHTLGRERISTPAGLFDTIRVRTRPLHEGVFQNKGEVDIWLTDDERKVPVLMKSTIKVGSFVFTLTGMRPGTPWAQQTALNTVAQ